mmetsp:Transcript_13654/g.28204  ORF Transcript_13654/g.28204 Transcript_13654/m.28204 type:complete len:467 (-) Transcript_13654:132-1532(-)
MASSAPSGILRPSSYSNLQSFLKEDAVRPVGTTTPPPSPRRALSMHRKSSSTILNHEQLSHCSTERFYMLGELQMHSCKPILLRADDELDEALREDEEECVPRYSILYVLWRPDTMTNDPDEFVNDVLVPAIEMIEKRVDIVPSPDHLFMETPLSSGSFDEEGTAASFENSKGEAKQSSQSVDGSNHDEKKRPQSTSLYIVVDRAVVFESSSNDSSEEENNEAELAHYAQQEELANQVVRQAALLLRDRCEGISVFCANHERAAPGLEACMNAVLVGTSDRRRFVNKSKSFSPFSQRRSSSSDSNSHENHQWSYCGTVALQSNDFLGMQLQAETDAVQGVMQSFWCAEWNGRGNLASFAKRAHTQWCLDRNLPAYFTAVSGDGDEDGNGSNGRRSRGRRNRKRSKAAGASAVDELALDQAIKSFLTDFGVIAFCIFYLLFHYGHDVYKFFDTGIEEMIVGLRNRQR